MAGEEVFVVNSGHTPRAVIAGALDNNFTGVGHFTFVGNGNNSYDPDGTIQSYAWSFGDFNACPTDGCTAVGPYASHTYTTQGFYSASLQVTDNEGNSHFSYVNINVTPSYKAKRVVEAAHDSPARAIQRRNLTGACATKNASACYFLGKMYAEDGDTFAASQLYQKSCSLGYAPACSSK